MGQTTTVRISDDTKRMLERIRVDFKMDGDSYDKLVKDALDMYAVLRRAGFAGPATSDQRPKKGILNGI